MAVAVDVEVKTKNRGDAHPLTDTVLTSYGKPLDLSPNAFGLLRRSDDVVDDTAALRARMQEDGYLYLPGYLSRERVLEARRFLLEQLAAKGIVDPSAPLDDAVARRAEKGGYAKLDGSPSTAGSALASANPILMEVLYSGRMIELYERLLGGPILHFSRSWLRVKPPGKGTDSHSDIVFMGRGTPNVCTAWTPLGDIDMRLGGLMVLEQTHKNEALKNTYGKTDVDRVCENRFDGAWFAPDGTRNRPRNGGVAFLGDELAFDTAEPIAGGHGSALSVDHPALRARLGGRWLTANFRAGDLLTFGMHLVHASLDNATDRLRLSTDTRYQLASEATDPRWVGPNATGHGPAAARNAIC
jgi:hypothetical protein